MSHPVGRGLFLAAAAFSLLTVCCDPVAAQANPGAVAKAPSASAGVAAKASEPNASSGNQVSTPAGARAEEVKAEEVKSKDDRNKDDKTKAETQHDTPMGVPLTLLILLAGGFFGGLVDGLGTSVNYKFAIPHRVAASAAAIGGEWELGFLGNGLVGVLAAFSIFAVSGVVFPGAESMSARNIEPVRLISWALVAGYLGPRLLRLIAEKLESLDEVKNRQNATEQKVHENTKLASTTQQKLQESEDANPNLQDAQRWLTSFLVAVDLNPEKAQKVDYLGNAQRKFDLVLKQNPSNIAALIGLANVSAERGTLKVLKDPNADLLDDWKTGIAKLDEAVKADPRSAKAHYNRACFKARAVACLSGKDSYKTDEIFADLRTAYELQPSFRDYASQDRDFKELRESGKLTPAEMDLIK